MISTRTGLALAAGLMAIAAAGRGWAQTPPLDPPPASGIVQAIENGTPVLDVRSRFEDVDQAKLTHTAQSFTTRVQAGWQTADFHGVTVLVEFAGAFHIDDGHYNVAIPGGVSLNGQTQYPIINDPGFATLNRAQVAWTPAKPVTLTVGRQRILIDDQRFIGNSGWRQDEQRFDSARADLALGPLSATYVYVWRVDRIFGGQLDWASDSHLANVAYAVAPPLRLEGFVYALDFRNASPTNLASAEANASLTYGAKASGKLKRGAVTLAYDATWARQGDYRGRTAPFALDFWQGDVAATLGAFTARLDYEELGGDGARGFTTPLATTHGFQGWADAFAATAGNKTHVDGIGDINVTLIARPEWKAPLVAHPELLVRYFDFHAPFTGAYLGYEWDAQAQASLTSKLTAAVKYAEFVRATTVPAGTVAPPASRTKLWVTLEFKL